ncbi:MAG TPA: hypothetical protein VFS43_04555 [Polyangiaceae bacterium]|nr:hypothetical protein [Polyangiaceae bacterium]
MNARNLFALLALVAGCRPPVGPAQPPDQATVPIVHASEAQDEWLYAHCTFIGLLDAESEAAPAQAAARGATVGEIVYEDGATLNVSLFACRPNPPWAGGPASGDAATAEAPGGSPAPRPADGPAAPKPASAPAKAARPASEPAGTKKPAPPAATKWM